MKAFEQFNGSRMEVFHEIDLTPSLDGPHGDSVRKILALEIGGVIDLPSGVRWSRVADDAPKTFTIVCGRGRSKPCKYCGSAHTKLCDYPVTRNGKPGTCDIAMCNRCTTRGGTDIDYCRPHAKIVKSGGAASR